MLLNFLGQIFAQEALHRASDLVPVSRSACHPRSRIGECPPRSISGLPDVVSMPSEGSAIVKKWQACHSYTLCHLLPAGPWSSKAKSIPCPTSASLTAALLLLCQFSDGIKHIGHFHQKCQGMRSCVGPQPVQFSLNAPAAVLLLESVHLLSYLSIYSLFTSVPTYYTCPCTTHRCPFNRALHGGRDYSHICTRHKPYKYA